jgi:hypothetical protein
MSFICLCAIFMIFSIACKNDSSHKKGTAPFFSLNENDIVFAAFGDAGTGEKGQYQVGQLLREVCEREACDFVVGLGDNFYQTGIVSVNDDQLRSKFLSLQ